MDRKYICDAIHMHMRERVCARVALWSTNSRRNDFAKFMNLYGENVFFVLHKIVQRHTHNVWANSLHLYTDYNLIRSKSICG